MDKYIYKIATSIQWEEAQAAGVFRGAPIDLADGFIHFSTAKQVRETAAKHFAGQDNLLLLTIDADELGPALKYEPSRGGDLFPHLHAELTLSSVKKVDPLPRAEDGKHIFPKHLAQT